MTDRDSDRDMTNDARGDSRARPEDADMDDDSGMDDESGMDSMDSMGEGRVDGNAVGGMLAVVFGREMTAAPGRCAHCGTVNEMGAMHVYMRGPGVVVRCPACGEVILRLVETGSATFLDARGVAFVRIEREAR